MDGFERFVDVAQYMVPAAITTLLVAAISFPGALIVASIVTVPRVFRVPVLSWIADQYVDFVRTTPLLLHLIFVFYALPFVGIRLDPAAGRHPDAQPPRRRVPVGSAQGRISGRAQGTRGGGHRAGHVPPGPDRGG